MWEAIASNKRKSALLIVLLASVLMGLGYAIGFVADPAGGPYGVLIAMVVWVVMMITSMVGGSQRIAFASSVGAASVP